MSTKLWTEEQFNCPVCLDLPNDPVTIPCGHSYCMDCIKDFWSKDDAKGEYSCPQCRKIFCPKPSLSRNTMLAEAVEQVRKAALKSDVRDSLRSGRSTVSVPASKSKGSRRLPRWAVLCDMCQGEKKAAVKSCLVCMSSYCEAHLKTHQSQPAMKQHELIVPTGQLAEKICTEHKYLQEFYCRQCKVFVCWLCNSNQHKGHECVSTKAERMERQKVLSEIQAENHQKLKRREHELKELKKMMETMKRSADRVCGDSDSVLLELQRSVERLQELLKELLEQASQERTAEAKEVTGELEAEIKERRKRDNEMKDLARCEDHIHYLQTCEAMCSPLEAEELAGIQVNPGASYEPVRDAILDLRERVEDLCNQELDKIAKQVHDTAPFTLGDSGASTNAPKGGILKLFSGLGVRNATSRPQGANSLSVGLRGHERRPLGIGVRSRDVRSRDAPHDRRSSNSPRPQDRQKRVDRDSGRETHSPTPSRRESQSHSLWNRPNQNQALPAATATPPSPAEVPAPTQTLTPASTGGFSRMTSISSLFRSHRRGNAQATSPPAPAALSNPPLGGGNPWGMAALAETPPDVNPSLFLDLPPPDSINHTPAFPTLREINLDSIKAPEPRTREEFLQYSVNLILDPNTAHRRLALSEGNTKATLQAAAQPYADLPQRFDGWTQVMCQSPLYAQRCYWEVEWRGRGSSLGVVYGALTRKGSDARAGLGYNAQSWSLELSDTCCSAMHDNQKRDIPVTYSPRLGVFLDLSEGTLAFYSVADSMTHLHTFRGNFTQPLYAAFGVGSGVGVGLDFALGQFSSSTDSIKICSV